MVEQGFVEEILNTNIKDRIQCILKFQPPSKDQDFSIVVEDLLSYSSLKPLEELEANFKEDIQNNEHILILLKDDESSLKERAKLKLETYSKLLEIVKNKGYKVWIHILLSSDIIAISMDSKFALFDILLKAEPLYDDGTYEIYKTVIIHKNKVLNTFKKYVVAYVIAGSYVKGNFTPESDIDVYVVIDDTDVKQHTFTELKLKLYDMIGQMALEAMALANTKRILHHQVYTLTEFWKAISESNPVIITFLRDGIALYDRGMFIAWKTLLMKGEIKPSEEAVEKYFAVSTNAIQDVKRKLKELLFIDIPEIMLLSAQAAIMNYGILAPDPKEAPEYLRKIFVEEKKLLESDYPKKLKEVIKIRKDIEHGKKDIITGEEIDRWLKIAEEFINRMKNLKSQIDNEKEKLRVSNLIKELYIVIDEAEELFNESINNIVENKLPSEKQKFKDLKLEIEKYNEGKLDLVDLTTLRKNLEEFIRTLKKLVDLKKMELLKRMSFTVISNNRRYNIYVVGDVMFVVGDEIIKYDISEDTPKRIGSYERTKIEEVVLTKVKDQGSSNINKKILRALDMIFGEYEISLI